MSRTAGSKPRRASKGEADGTVHTTAASRLKRKSFANYAAAERWLDKRPNIERKRPDRVAADELKLDRVRAICELLGDPHLATPVAHVAGSKGKGSVVEMTASCLAACGYATGVFTSPHLVSVRERIRVGTEPISEKEFAKLLAKVAAACDAVEQELGPASFFEALTALAFVYFSEQAVDCAVIEVGLGGRLDSTNIVTPTVTAITQIQLEHTQILGDTLARIAAEKAGIFKPGVPAITMPQADEVLDVLRERAAETKCELRVLGKDVEYSARFGSTPDLGPHTRVCVASDRGGYEHLAVPLLGEHQAHNCGVALAILDALKEHGFDLPETLVARGLAETPRRGRMEVIHERPRIMIDGAHNPESIKALVRAIGAHHKTDSMVVVFGCAEDKDIDAMLKEIALGADKIIFTAAEGNARHADPAELQKRFADEHGKMAQVEPDLKAALNTAARAVSPGDLICVTGSFHLAGEAKRLLLEKQARTGDN